MYAIKTEITEPNANHWNFVGQKTMYAGKYISVGESIYVFASESEGGHGLNPPNLSQIS